mmetsp:Transcript_9007/g.27077  ORF Transcript_9007/g.27077 Transcript_9007/m.27077 type:complete len:217 (-) Transcript_9007:50-700(-)
MSGSEWAALRRKAEIAAEEAEEAISELHNSRKQGRERDERFRSKEKLSAFAAQIDHLRLAVACDKASEREKRRRMDIVSVYENKQDSLKSRFQDLDGFRADRDELLRNSNTSYGATETPLQAQEREIQEQQNQIDSTSTTVRNAKHIAKAINQEIDNQLKILDGMESGMGQARSNVQRANETVSEPVHNPYNLRAFCTILWPLVLLIMAIFYSIFH